MFWQTQNYWLKQKCTTQNDTWNATSYTGWVNHLTISFLPHSWSSRSLRAWGRCASTLRCCPVGWPDRLPAPGRTRECPQSTSAAHTGGEKLLRRRGGQHSVSKWAQQLIDTLNNNYVKGEADVQLVDFCIFLLSLYCYPWKQIETRCWNIWLQSSRV